MTKYTMYGDRGSLGKLMEVMRVDRVLSEEANGLEGPKNIWLLG